MTALLTILRAGPLTTIQDEGRFGMLKHGISASGPMDTGAFHLASIGGRGGIEFTTTGLDFRVESGKLRIGFAGGNFKIAINNLPVSWPGRANLQVGSIVSVRPGAWGNYGYLRFDRDIIAKPVMGSISTSSRVRLGGMSGRPLHAEDVVELAPYGTSPPTKTSPCQMDGPFRCIWGVHADMFDGSLRQRFLAASFTVSNQMDRMGVRLVDQAGVFASASKLSLVSDAIILGDIQILGDGTPVVLMRDHQPTGGYPRIATIITADLNRFAQTRPGTAIAFTAVTVEHAQQLLRSLA